MTFVYRADGNGALAAVNRALDDAGFRPSAVPADAQVPHDADWPARISELLPAR